MPELPEVETLRRELAALIVNQTIKRVEVRWLKMIRPLGAAALNRKLIGRKIIGVERSAKVLVIALDSGDHLLIHLKMTGQLIYVAKNKKGENSKESPFRHTRVIFDFSDGAKLFFNDLRKFGWLKLAGAEELRNLRMTAGLEPLQPTFTFAAFNDILAHYPRRPVKQLLLDQTLIAGLGNIYADESCFAAKVLPARKVGSLKSTEKKLLHRAIIRILRLAIAKKGTSARNYVRADGTPGGFVPYLRVYGRAGEKCKRCRTGIIQRIKLNGRGTHFCSGCQK